MKQFLLQLRALINNVLSVFLTKTLKFLVLVLIVLLTALVCFEALLSSPSPPSLHLVSSPPLARGSVSSLHAMTNDVLSVSRF